MLPIIFSLGPITLYTYVVFLFLAVIFSLFVLWKRGREAHFDEEEVMRVSLQLMLWGIIGSRVLYVITHWQLFQSEWWQIFNLFGRPGYEILGGLLTMAGVYVVKVKKLKWELWAGADVMILGFVLWEGVMSLADFFNGSGAGLPTTWFIGVYFVGMFEKRLPVQLLEFLLYGGLFWILWWLESHYRTFSWYKGNKSEANSGFILGVASLGMALIILITELLKPDRLVLLGVIRLEVLLAIGLLSFSLFLFHIRSGTGLIGIGSAWLSEWGVTGSLVEKWQRKRRDPTSSQRLKLGQDIFE
jgi:prolipoprotein diacylglyceryltransferase